MEELSVVGRRLPRIDAGEKVRGMARYTSDLTLPGMLFGNILRSPFAHARILKIDVSRAENLPGVKAIISAKDTPGFRYLYVAPQFQDKFIFATDRVRYVGDEIAAVAAESMEIAEKAIKLIDVTYEVLPVVLNPEEAMGPGVVRIHEVENNIAMKVLRKYGDVEQGFRDSDFVFEDRFETQAVAHCCMETHGSLVTFDPQGRLNIWTPTQSPYFVQKELSIVLGMPASKIRVMEVPVGGGFGSRAKICSDEAICSLLAMRTRRPVKVVLTREEEFATTSTRHPSIITLKTGVRKDGTLRARQMKIVMDNGAYNHQGPAVLGYATLAATSHYRVPCAKIESYLVYTNKQYGGPFRGYGNPQVAFAIESQMDMIADRLGSDRLGIRLKNCNLPGEVTPCGWRITSNGFKECLLKVSEEMKFERREKNPLKDRGVGIAGLVHVTGAKVFSDGDFSSVMIKLSDEGFATVFTGTADIGQGSSTTLAMIAAEELGLSIEDIDIRTMDTDVNPVDLGTWASRIAFIGGNAVRKAAQDIKRQVLESVSQTLECSPEDLLIKDKKIWVRGFPEKTVSLAEAVLRSPYRLGKMLLGRGHYDPPSEPSNRETGIANIAAAYSFGAQGVEVEVDRDTGKVRVLRVVGAYDVGRPINPDIVEGQIEGGILQGIGYALTERVICDGGEVRNSNFLDYKVLFSTDMPEIEIHFVDTIDPEGPFGAKGVGEPAFIPTAPAIANAISNAIGVRVKHLPIIQEDIVELLRKSQKTSY